MQRNPLVTFEEVLARAVLNPTLHDRVMSSSDAVVAALTGLPTEELPRLRRVLYDIRTASTPTTAAVDRVTRAADRTMQK